MDPMPSTVEGEIPKKFNWTPVFVVGILLWLVILVFSLIFFEVIDFGRFLPLWRPARNATQSVAGGPVATQSTPLPSAPQVLEVDQNYPQLPLPLYHSIVKGASVYYRLVGTVSSLIPQGEENLGITVAGEDGVAYPTLFTISGKQTVVTEKGKGFAGFSLSEMKVGDKVELIYTVDLRSGQSLITQAQVERGE